jgi:hypothetical protein
LFARMPALSFYLDDGRRQPPTPFFQDSYLARENSPVGLLCQVWLPEHGPGGDQQLVTKGLPFCVAGMGDLLALFRCISCRFRFGTDAAHPDVLGAPGRVYISGEPELACNVQEYPREAYLRRAEAEQCRIQSSMLLPVFDLNGTASSPKSLPDNHVRAAVGVIEIVQTSDDMAFLPVAHILGRVLRKCGLDTSKVDEVRGCLPTAASHLHLPTRTGLLGEPHGAENSGSARASMDSSAQGPIAEEGEEGELEDEMDGDVGDSEQPDKFPSPYPRRGAATGSTKPHSRGASAVARKPSRGGRSGANLSLADLQSQFGVGLKEAAAALGICTTTLKRACRRHGIQRWPRRALQKVSKALDEMERRGNMPNSMFGMTFTGGSAPGLEAANPLAMEPLPMGSMPTSVHGWQQPMPGLVDSRWNALANMIPGQLPPMMPPTVPAWLAPPAGANTPSHAAAMAPSEGTSLPEGVIPMGGLATSKAAPTVATDLSGWDNRMPAMTTEAQHRFQILASSVAPRPLGAPTPHQGINAAHVNAVAFNDSDQRNHPGAAPRSRSRASFESPFASHERKDGPVLRLPGAAPSLGSVPPLPSFSQLSIPSMNPSLLQGMSFGEGSAALRGPEPNAGSPLGERQSALDDVGLLDSTILELMLSEDVAKNMVGMTTDDDLKRLFGSVLHESVGVPVPKR